VIRNAIEDAAHFHDRAGFRELIIENLGAIGRGEYGFADVDADLALVDIKSGDHFDVVRPIRSDLLVHQTNGSTVARRAAVETNSLDQRTGAVAHTDNRDRDLAHGSG
jgi:hypothetical protein